MTKLTGKLSTVLFKGGIDIHKYIFDCIKHDINDNWKEFTETTKVFYLSTGKNLDKDCDEYYGIDSKNVFIYNTFTGYKNMLPNYFDSFLYALKSVIDTSNKYPIYIIIDSSILSSDKSHTPEERLSTRKYFIGFIESLVDMAMKPDSNITLFTYYEIFEKPYTDYYPRFLDKEEYIKCGYSIIYLSYYIFRIDTVDDKHYEIRFLKNKDIDMNRFKEYVGYNSDDGSLYTCYTIPRLIRHAEESASNGSCNCNKKLDETEE